MKLPKNQINHQLHYFYKAIFTEKLQIQNENITYHIRISKSKKHSSTYWRTVTNM